MRQRGFISVIFICIVLGIGALLSIVTYKLIQKTPTSVNNFSTPTLRPLSTQTPSTLSPTSSSLPNKKTTTPVKTSSPKPTQTSTPSQTTTSSTSSPTATPTVSPTNTPSPTPTTTSYPIASSCSSVTVSGATYAGVVGGKPLYYAASGGSVTLHANTTPTNGSINWKIASSSSQLPNGGTFSTNNNPDTVYTAPTNTSGSDQGVEIRGDASESPNPWIYCPPFTIGVHTN